MNIYLRMPVSDNCPTYERYSERNNDDDVNYEEPGQELNSSWRDEWLLQLDMARKATQKFQEYTSENDNPLRFGIFKEKKETIVKKLCPMMPCTRCQFWLSLQVTDVPDLTIDEEEPYEDE
ncbi:hypothetical protein QYM36_008540 [Artemia franciscana]|uniref:Uncharacterized protein n=1 Tax=Artemia franciscana TaxID=6661 RepID=A0AA88IIP7_ARTSF|nr:hypothetical protein QYM36_008540 [Artemia franciscana]